MSQTADIAWDVDAKYLQRESPRDTRAQVAAHVCERASGWVGNPDTRHTFRRCRPRVLSDSERVPRLAVSDSKRSAGGLARRVLGLSVESSEMGKFRTGTCSRRSLIMVAAITTNILQVGMHLSAAFRERYAAVTDDKLKLS